MTILTSVWLGSGTSLTEYNNLRETFAGKPPETFAVSPVKAELFSTTEDRIGLMLLERRGAAAIINIHGVLVNSHEWWHPFALGHIASYAAIRDAVSIILEDNSITDVLLSIESTGGAVSGIDTASDAIARLKRSKTVNAHTSTVATSAGYWLACTAERLTANRMAQLGSVGVIAIYQDFSKSAEDHGVKFEVFSAGKEKAYGFGGVEFTDEERETIQAHVQKTYNFFLSHVARNRDLRVGDREQWADAKIFYAGEARSVGLIDAIAKIDDVLSGKTAVTKGRGKAMTINEEKLARISAGEDPETVLTPEELDVFLSANPSTEAEDDVTPEQEAAATASEVEEGEAAPTESDGLAASALTELSRDLGRAEAMLEAKESQIEKMKAELEENEEVIKSLKEVAQAAVTNLQVALGSPREKLSAPSEIVEQYTTLRKELEGRMPKGRVSSATATTTEKPETITSPLRYWEK